MALLTEHDVVNMRFKAPNSVKEGYDQDEVDFFLDEVAETIAQLVGGLPMGQSGSMGCSSQTGRNGRAAPRPCHRRPRPAYRCSLRLPCPSPRRLRPCPGPA